MLDPYRQIPHDKRDSIYQATIKEFAEHGYNKASTNQIIQEAGISKGLLFHYFKNKKTLYLATFDQALNQFLDQINPYYKDLPADFFDRLLYLGRVKLRLYSQQPFLYAFIISAYDEFVEKFPEELEKRVEQILAANMPLLLDGIDQSKFRADVDISKAIEFIYLGLDAMNKKLIKEALCMPDKGLDQWDVNMKDYEQILDFFKYGVYRKEE